MAPEVRYYCVAGHCSVRYPDPRLGLEFEQRENVDQAEVGLDGASARRAFSNFDIEQRGLVGPRLASKPGATVAGLSVVGGPGGCPWARP